MKTRTKITYLLLLMISAISCDEIDKLTEFDVTDDFSTTVNVSVPLDSEGMPQSYTNSTTISIVSNQQINDNLNLIQSISLNSLAYEISNFTGAEGATLTEASLNIGATNIAISNINLKASDDNNTVYSIEDSGQINAIASALKTNPTITVTVSGTVSETPVSFDIIISIDTTVTIDVI